MIAALAGLVSPHPLPAPLLDRVHGLLPRSIAGTPVTHGFDAVTFRTTVDTGSGPALRAELRRLAEVYDVDASLVWGPLATDGPGLIVMDVDSTLITAEVVELLAARAGTREMVADITERAMRGELDFAASLAERVATLRGLPESVLDEVRAEIRLSPGAEELIGAVQDRGAAVGLVSGGFVEIIEPLATRLGISLLTANRLEVADGLLTGRTTGPVIDRVAKRQHLFAYAERLGLTSERVVAIGDGANDLDMINAAALGVAYCAKPVTRAASDAAISFPRLDAVRVFTGI